MTKIIATIGPACNNLQTLNFFRQKDVAIARLNCSHGEVSGHLANGQLAKEAGLQVLMDLPGPKIRLGIMQSLEVKVGQKLFLEMQDTEKSYPYLQTFENQTLQVLPYQFPLHQFVQAGQPILVDDGKMEWVVETVSQNGLLVKVLTDGLVKERKGLNTPKSDLQTEFLTSRDLLFLNDLLPVLRPEYVAASFVKTPTDVDHLQEQIHKILSTKNITDYTPKICIKIEMGQAIENLSSLVNKSDLIMIARGDLALETLPTHLLTPFLQDKIAQECQRQGKPFVVATQILESMIDSPVPTRAEVSDLYRAVVLNKANYVMCSAETAVGKYPENCIELMSQMIQLSNQQ